MKLYQSIFTIALIAMFTNTSIAQFHNRLERAAQRAAERTVERKVEQKVEKETSEAFDRAFEGDNKNNNRNNNKSNSSSSSNNSNNQDGTQQPGKTTVNTAKDFERGKKIIFQETFRNDAIGDFPVTWNTNSSGEVVTFGNDNTRWLKLPGGFFMPEAVTNIPENSTLEMDVYYDNTYVTIADLIIQLTALENQATAVSELGKGGVKNGVVLSICPDYQKSGKVYLWNKVDGKTVLQTPHKGTTKFTGTKKTVHVSLWRQGNRLRVYLDDEKVLDLPKAFADKKYNTLSFISKGSEQKPYYVSNIILAAEAGADTRHKLLETGTFSTSDILFETGKATIQSSSFGIIDEIGEVLKSNPSKHLTITGHTDSDGNAGSNQTLSEQRAESVKNYLVYKHNISSSQITTVGKGASQPVANGNSADAKAKNRRVEFTLK